MKRLDRMWEHWIRICDALDIRVVRAELLAFGVKHRTVFTIGRRLARLS